MRKIKRDCLLRPDIRDISLTLLCDDGRHKTENEQNNNDGTHTHSHVIICDAGVYHPIGFHASAAFVGA